MKKLHFLENYILLLDLIGNIGIGDVVVIPKTKDDRDNPNIIGTVINETESRFLVGVKGDSYFDVSVPKSGHYKPTKVINYMKTRYSSDSLDVPEFEKGNEKLVSHLLPLLYPLTEEDIHTLNTSDQTLNLGQVIQILVDMYDIFLDDNREPQYVEILDYIKHFKKGIFNCLNFK